MGDQDIATLLREIADSDEIIRETPIFVPKDESVPAPLISVNIQRVALPGEQDDAYRIRSFPVSMQRVALSIEPETIRRAFRNMPQAVSQLTEAHSRRTAAELRLALLYGITCYNGIPVARAIRERVLPPLINLG